MLINRKCHIFQLLAMKIKIKLITVIDGDHGVDRMMG